MNASKEDLETSLRIVAANNKGIFANLDFDNLNPIQEKTFFPVCRRCFNKEFIPGTRITDLVWKRGDNTVNFNDFIIDEELHLFFIFYYERSDNFEIYVVNLVSDGEIIDTSVVDKRLPNFKEHDSFVPPGNDIKYLTGVTINFDGGKSNFIV